MRSYRRMTSRRHGGESNNFWLSFSDLMSSLVLIIILVMFYIIYQYFNTVEINEAETARREFELDQAQIELQAQQTALAAAEQQVTLQETLLDTKQQELDAAEVALAAQQTELTTAQTQLETLGAQLTAREGELASAQQELQAAQTQLGIQQGELASAQLELQTAQAALASQQVQIEQLVGMRTRIITSLSDALRNSKISATVDSTTGSITLESDVLFATGEYELTPQGRSFIDRLLPVYLDVLFSAEYRPYVSEIIIEGHTDSVGGYLSNLELSQQRALAVASYVLGDSLAVASDVKNQLRAVVTVNGRSYSDRIFDEHGVEDRDASRRVVFKFRLTDEQMIQQLRTILEGAE